MSDSREELELKQEVLESLDGWRVERNRTADEDGIGEKMEREFCDGQGLPSPQGQEDSRE